MLCLFDLHKLLPWWLPPIQRAILGEEGDEGRIVYDDEAISQLLDRSKEGQEEKEVAMNEYFSSFKVASYAVKEGESDVSNDFVWKYIWEDVPLSFM